MSPGTRMEYLQIIYSRNKIANRKEKSIFLNEFCQNCEYHRKHGIRALNTFKRFNQRSEGSHQSIRMKGWVDEKAI